MDFGPTLELQPPRPLPAPRPARPIVAPIAESRYVAKVTVGANTHAKLSRAQELLRHTIPNGDPAKILERALTLLVDQLERRQLGKAQRPRAGSRRRPAGSEQTRQVPADVRRAVWARDEGRCGFEGAQGRCTATGFLELHHVIPFASGGPTTTENLSLRCRAHNLFEAGRECGP
jgi:hypothetical protein